MTDEQKFVRDLLTRMMDAAGTDRTGLARMAGLAPSTITRVFESDAKHVLTTTTLFKLSRATGIPLAATAARPQDTVSKVDIVLTVAKSLGVAAEDLAAACAQGFNPRLIEWIDVVRRLPPTAEHHALETLRGIVEATHPAQKNSEPREPARVRRSG